MELIAFRWADYDRPFWVNANTREGRYQRAGSDPTQYWALHPLGPWAEYLRGNGISSAVPVEGVDQRVWAARFLFGDDEVLTVSFDWARTTGEIDPHDLVADDFAACQHFADRVRLTQRALVVPSASLPGTQNLVVFGARAASPYQLSPIDTDIDVPTSVVAEHGRPPLSLSDYVRYRGQSHAELEAWRAGDAYYAPPPIGVPPPTPLV